MKEEKRIEKVNRRAMRKGLQDMIAGGLKKKYGTATPKQIRAMAKQMAQGKHPAMGIDF